MIIDSFDLPSDSILAKLTALTGKRVEITVNGKTLRIYEQQQQSWAGTKSGEKSGWVKPYNENIIAPI